LLIEENDTGIRLVDYQFYEMCLSSTHGFDREHPSGKLEIALTRNCKKESKKIHYNFIFIVLLINVYRRLSLQGLIDLP